MRDVSEKALRVKYTRLQEKLLQSSTTILKLENFNYPLFEKKIKKIYEKIENLPEVRADSSYLILLKNFTNLTIRTINSEKLKPQEKREILLKEVNLLQKQKNRSIYKRSKKIDEND